VKEYGISRGKCGVKEQSDWEEFVKRDCDAIRRGGDGWLNAESYLKFTVYGQDSLHKI